MSVSERDISVLIPTYRYRDRVGSAVASALASGAGEVIVVDDHSRDGTLELLAAIDDPRLIVHENAANLGLWENHLAALSLATKPWIKFLQADDILLPDGLARIAAVADANVSVVWSNPRFVEEGREFALYSLAAPLRLAAPDTLSMLKRYGWVLGSPSMMLLRRDCIEGDPFIWRRDVSVDLVVGTLAASRGDTVLLPIGTLLAICHPGQDSHNQGVELAIRRAYESAKILTGRPERALREHGICVATAAFIIWSRALAGQFLRGSMPSRQTWRFWLGLVSSQKPREWMVVFSNAHKICQAVHHAWWARRPTSLDLD